jgi:hypothetical protein
MNSPNFFDFSNNVPVKKSLVQSKLQNINHSVISTRDQSQNRNVTPTNAGDKLKVKNSLKSGKESSELILNDMKKQLDTLFESLPKIPRYLNMHKTQKKDLESSMQSRKNDSINNMTSVYSKDRSKSTFNRSKRYLPKIKKEGADLLKLQEYLTEFHNKSKFLLEQLEQNVLGNKRVKDHDRSF